MSMSPEQQLEKLRRAAQLSWVPMGLLAVTVGLFAVGFLTGYEVFFVLSAFTGLGAVASRESAPHWRNAIRATGEGQRSKGKVSITVTEYDDALEYRAIVRDASTCTWSFQFSPQHWFPVEGCFEADILHICGVEWPVLLVTQEGILFPSFEPKRFAENA